MGENLTVDARCPNRGCDGLIAKTVRTGDNSLRQD